MRFELWIPRVDSGGHEGQIKADARCIAQMTEEIHLSRNSRHGHCAEVIGILEIVLCFGHAFVNQSFLITSAFFILIFAAGNLLGPLTLGRLFDTVGRKPMIAGTLVVSAGLLALDAWPSHDGLDDEVAEGEIGWVIDLVTAIRSVRVEMNIPPATLLPLVLANASPQTAVRATHWSEFVQRLARVA